MALPPHQHSPALPPAPLVPEAPPPTPLARTSTWLIRTSTLLIAVALIATASFFAYHDGRYHLIIPAAFIASASSALLFAALSRHRWYRATIGTLCVFYSLLAVYSTQIWHLHPVLALGGWALGVGITGIILGLNASLHNERNHLQQQITIHQQTAQAAYITHMAQLSRFAELGRLAGGIVHDIANPLTAVTLSLEQLSEDIEGPEPHPQIKRLRRATRRIESFLAAARRQIQQQEAVPERFCFNDEIEAAIDIMRYKAKQARVTLYFFADKKAYLYGNPIKCYQAISNLVSNAIDAYEEQDDGTYFPEPREVYITLRVTPQAITLTVQDWGIGIPPEHLSHIFNPFFTTKKLYCGTGLGLSVCKEAIEKYCGGTIAVDSVSGAGSTFIVSFPLPITYRLPPDIAQSLKTIPQ